MGKAALGRAGGRYDRDMRSRVLFLTSFAVLGVFVLPLVASAHSIPYFGPIIETDWQTCALGWGAVILVINNLITMGITLAMLIVAPVMIAWAGFLMVVNPTSIGDVKKAKDIITNTILGIIIAMAGWLIVDAVMAVLYHPDAKDWTTDWSSLITTGGLPACMVQAGSMQAFNQAVGGPSVSVGGTVVGTANGQDVLSFGSTGTACDAETILQQDSSMSTSMANELACIAQGESSCGANNQNYNWDKSPNPSTAWGPYQVLLKKNSACYDNLICEQAAGTPGTSLDCAAAFDSKGFSISGPTLTKCQQAAANIGCSAAAAQCLLRQQTFQSAYATDKYLNSCSAL